MSRDNLLTWVSHVIFVLIRAIAPLMKLALVTECQRLIGCGPHVRDEAVVEGLVHRDEEKLAPLVSIEVAGA